MTIISVTEAVKLTGKSAPTLYRHINKGKLSRTTEGLDTSELIRVYGPLKGLGGVSNETDKRDDSSLSLSQKQIYEMELDSLKKQLEQQTSQVTYLKDEISYLKGEIKINQKEKSEIIQVMKQLPSPDSFVDKVKSFWK